MSDFVRQIRNFADKTSAKQEKVARAVCIGLSSDVILRTPVDTGRARANWQPAFEPASGELDAVDKSGRKTVAGVRAKVQELRAGVTFWLVNNLPYISRLEYDNWSKQYPGGMVRLALQRFDFYLKQAVREVNP